MDIFNLAKEVFIFGGPRILANMGLFHEIQSILFHPSASWQGLL